MDMADQTLPQYTLTSSSSSSSSSSSRGDRDGDSKSISTLPQLPTNATDAIKSYLEPTSSAPLAYHLKRIGGVDDATTPSQIQAMIDEQETADAVRLSLASCQPPEDTKVAYIEPIVHRATHFVSAKDTSTAHEIACEMGISDESLGLDSESMGLRSERYPCNSEGEEDSESEAANLANRTSSGKAVKRLGSQTDRQPLVNQMRLIRLDMIGMSSELAAIGKLLKKDSKITAHTGGEQLIRQANGMSAQVDSIAAQVNIIASEVDKIAVRIGAATSAIDEKAHRTDLFLREMDAKLTKIVNHLAQSKPVVDYPVKEFIP